MGQNIIYRYLLLASAFILLTGCIKDPEMGSKANPNGSFTLTAVAQSMSPEQVITRASDPKSEAEREIRSLHVFLFGPDNNYLATKEGYGSFQGYQYISSSTLNIDGNAFVNPDYAAHATVYVVANVEPETFGSITAEGYPEKVRNKADFDAFYYQPIRRETLTSLPKHGMPMFGSVLDVPLTQTNGSVVIELKALMARIDFTFSIDASNGTTGALPSLTLTEYQVRNMATAISFITPAQESNLDRNQDGRIDDTTSFTQYIDPSSSTLYNRQGKTTLSFYVYENLRLPGYAEYPNAYPYPENLDAEHQQRYKPLLAINANNDTIPATYAVFKGIFTDADDIDYQATCTILLGSDPVSDFNVKRNHQYKNNVTITGITAAGNTPSDVVTFDARIDVEHTSPYYISILRHKDLDAHFNVVPMDVYLFDETAANEIDVRIDNPETNNWFRIERVSADVMRSGSAASNQLSHPGEAFAPGTGKRRYFTQNLVTDPNQLGNSTATTMYNRDRIYIYVDENISVNSRQADLILEYKENGTIKDTRTITLIQHGLMPVRVEDGGEYQYTIYVEAYEEYQNYYDPLSSWNSDQIYDGLPWGPANMGTIHTAWIGGYLSEKAAVENYFEGKKGTIAILIETGIFNEYLDWGFWYPNNDPERAMQLDDIPQTAAEYCYRKNKTDNSGMISVENTCWYLPAIRELENTLTTYYSIYKDFQDYFYWSSAAANQSSRGTTEASEYARATKAWVKSDGSIGHIPSGYNELYDPNLGSASTGGKALRTERLRIRAVYRPANGGLIDGDTY